MSKNKDTVLAEGALRYLVKVGYNHGWSAHTKLVGKSYEDDFGEKFDFDGLREPEKSIIRAMIEAAPDGWRNISTLPLEEGQRILVTDGETISMARTGQPWSHGENEFYTDWPMEDPTHWQPIEPPRGDREG